MVRVRITKSHIGLGRVLEAGQELDLSDSQAHEKIRNGKAVRVVPVAAAVSAPSPVPAANAPAPNRESLDAALAQLPGEYTDADYVVGGMRAHYGDVFTAADEAKVRELVKPLPPATEGGAQTNETRTTEGAAEHADPASGKKSKGKK